MSTQVKVITTPTKIFGTYYKTICFEKAYTSQDEKVLVSKEAAACLFSIALTFGHVNAEAVEFDTEMGSREIFDYLDKTHTK